MTTFLHNLTRFFLITGDGRIRKPMITPRYLVAMVKPLLSSDLVRQHGVVCKFNVVGDGGGIFYLDLKNGN